MKTRDEIKFEEILGKLINKSFLLGKYQNSIDVTEEKNRNVEIRNIKEELIKIYEEASNESKNN